MLNLPEALEAKLHHLASHADLSVAAFLEKLLDDYLEGHLETVQPEYIRQHDHSFVVNVATADGIWFARCQDLGLVAEADSYDELIERVWQVLPELAAANAHDPDNIHVHFSQA